MEKKKDCIGCYNILKRNFPISFEWDNKVFKLETESQWRYKEVRISYQPIYYCPVCGKSLKELVQKVIEQG